ncbi:MAG TPA: hypothetical protein VM368_09810, partial [Flavisolibacter sp.]|nr:hypothetical protein [Flavisolibacter sp.]
YNGSNKIFDANKIFIANRNSAGVISSFRILSTTSYLVFPGDHIVVTENAASLRKEFMVENPSKIIELSLPSYPDDKGVVLITNAQGNVVDEVSYSHNWHFALINNKEGIALERIDPSAASNSASNWTSASSTSGFGTPTYKNSQLKQFNQNIATIELSSKIFSPDNDGIDDVAFISYQLDLPGFVGKVTIFDAQGRPVRYLVKNDLLGYKGRWSWDGLDEKKQRLPIGTYVVYTEIYNLQGKRQQFKNSIVLARRLK